MSVYTVSTRIRSNVPPSYIVYDLYIYRMDSKQNKHILLDVKQQPVTDTYETQKHETQDTDDALTVIYIMEVTLYRKTMLTITCVTPHPFVRMYTLEELSTGKAYSSEKRENPCFFVSVGTTRPVREGKNTIPINITRPERAFIAKEYPAGSLLDPFKKEAINAQIEYRFNQLDYPNQMGASVCGPAAFFYCLQVDRPDIYRQAARELWSYGKTRIGRLEVSPGIDCRHPSGKFYYDDGTPGISGLDWMTLAGLVDSDNTFLDYDSIVSPVAGVTMWGTLSEWFEKAGYEKIFSNAGPVQAGMQGFNELNSYASKGYRIVALISDGLLKGSDSILTIPSHWIVWEGCVHEDSNRNITLRLFSWGTVDNQIKENTDISFFLNRFFGGLVFKPIK
ncbi:hypothetical protein ACN0IV_08215 [Trabulsiella odontotermitis]|uniref:hypothetical protein n=1 Tax=Trabulsiella odontotermitis TaxID=379893 RepID=UPI003ACE8B54